MYWVSILTYQWSISALGIHVKDLAFAYWHQASASPVLGSKYVVNQRCLSMFRQLMIDIICISLNAPPLHNHSWQVRRFNTANSTRNSKQLFNGAVRVDIKAGTRQATPNDQAIQTITLKKSRKTYFFQSPKVNQ
ncbi:unnamed protein product [Absidia cylindrospora]